MLRAGGIRPAAFRRARFGRIRRCRTPGGSRSSGRARPRRGPPRRGHGPVRDPLRRARRAARRARNRVGRPGNVYTRVRETMDPGDERPASSPRSARPANELQTRCGPRRRAARFRSCWATTRSRSGRSAGWHRSTAPAVSSGSMRTPTSTRRRPRRAEPSTGCLSPLYWGERESGSRATAGRSPPGPRTGGADRSTERRSRRARCAPGGRCGRVHDLGRRPARRRAGPGRRRSSACPVRPSSTSPSISISWPVVAPGVGSPVTGGFSYREAHLAPGSSRKADSLHRSSLVEVNPILDHENATAKLAVELAASALGARIL